MFFPLGDLRFNLVEETDELLVAMLLHALPDDRTIQDIERGEQGGGSIALIVMVIVPQRPFFRGKPG